MNFIECILGHFQHLHIWPDKNKQKYGTLHYLEYWLTDRVTNSVFYFLLDLDFLLHKQARYHMAVLQIRITFMRIRILLVTFMRIRILASKLRLKTMKKCSNRLLFHIFWLAICKLMWIRIWILLITFLMGIRIQSL